MAAQSSGRYFRGTLQHAGVVWAAGMLTLVLAGPAFGAPPASSGDASDSDDPGVVDAAHERRLVRLVRQDCGACHGMRLTGGLGPALTPQALRDKPVDALVATTLQGRPGTAMPPWQAMVTPSEARWIVLRLRQGFPDE